jgi:hypothetical protein
VTTRQHYRIGSQQVLVGPEVWEEKRTPCHPRHPEAVLVSSEVLHPGPENLHAPTLDIDLPCMLVESSTPGHYHLYIDKAMPWEDYARLLNVLADVGIIERGYADASLRRGASFLRRPGVTKRDLPSLPQQDYV